MFNIRNRYNRRTLSAALSAVVLFTSIAGLGSVPAYAAGSEAGLQGPVREIYNNLLNPSGTVMSMAHRADWKHHPENSLSAVQGSIDEGADIAEMDIQRTSDGHYVLMHEDSVNRTTDGSGNVSSLPWSTVQALHLKMRWGDVSGDSANLTNETVPELREVMNLASGKILVNFDKMRDLYLTAKNRGLDGFTYWNEIWDILEETGTTQLAIFKGEVGDIPASEFERWVEHLRQTYPEASPVYMPIFSQANGTAEQIKTIIDAFAANTQLVKPVGYEVQFNSETASSISATVIQEIQRTGARVCINVMDDGVYNFNGLNAGNNDSAMYSNPAKGYPWIIQHGGNILQTDVAPLLHSYLESYGNGGGSIPPSTQTVTLQQNTAYTGTVDTHISQNAKYRDHNMGGNDRFEVGMYNQPLKLLPGSRIMSKLQSVTASSENTSGKEVAANLIDKDLATKWLGFVMSAKITFSFTEPVNLKGYSITSGNDSSGRDIKNWTLEGSMDGSTWFPVDSRSGEVFADRLVTNTYAFANNDSYLLYRLSVQNTGTDSSTQLAEIQLSDGGSDVPVLDTGDQHFGLLRFDLDSLPEGAQVTSTTLGLYVINTRSSTGKIDPQLIGVHQVNEAWGQGNGTGIDGTQASNPAYATWNSYMGGENPFEATPTVVQTVYGSDVETWKNFDITKLAQSWINDGAQNFGMLLKVEDKDLDKVSTKQFAASENVIQSLRPKLIVTYTVPVQGVSISETGPLAITVGDSLKLHAVTAPTGALNPKVLWSSDDDQVAQVAADGTVTALAEGTTNIVVTTIDGGKQASVQVDIAASGGAANLSSMKLSQGTISPAFSSSTTDYDIVLPGNGDSKLTLTPKTENSGASVMLSHNGGEPRLVQRGAGETFSLEVGTNLFEATVTSADGHKKQTYLFKVNKSALYYQYGTNGYTDSADAHIIMGAGHTNSNTGANNAFEVGYYDQLVTDAKYGLVRFGSLSDLPANAIITDAKLHLYLSAVRGRNASTLVRDTTLEVHEITAPWVEGTGTGIDGSTRLDNSWVWWSNQPAFDAVPVASTVVGTTPGSWYSWNITTLAQQWANDPVSNNGMLLKNPDPAVNSDVINTTKDFATKENADASLHPYLTVSYVLPSQGVQIAPSALNLAAGSHPVTLKAQMLPLNTTNESMTWNSDNEAVATVDSDGTVHPVSVGTAIITVTTGTSGYQATATINVHAPGTDARLSALSLSNMVLNPKFTPDVADYEVYVSSNATHLTFDAAANDSYASVKLIAPGGVEQTLIGGGEFDPIPLTEESMTITVEVTSEDGAAAQTYRLHVQQSAGLSGLSLSEGSLAPSFSPAVTSYTASVSDSVYALSVVPAAFDTSASITVSINGKDSQSLASGEESTPLSLQAGSNIILVQAQSVSGTANPMYSIIVNKPVGGGTNVPDEGGIRSIAFEASSYSLTVGETHKTVVQAVYDGTKAPILEGVTFLSANPAVAEIGTDGMLTAKQVGNANIIALYQGFHTAVQVTVSTANTPAEPNPGNGNSGNVGTGTPAPNTPAEVELPPSDGDINNSGPGNAPQTPAQPAVHFSDIQTHWADAQIEQAAALGIISGYEDGTFKPNEQVTRVQFAIMLVQALVLQSQAGEVEAGKIFKDQQDIPKWATSGLSDAVAAGFISGYEDGTLRPNKQINRAEMLTMLMRASGLSVDSTVSATFRDGADIPKWAVPSIEAASKLGIVKGRESGEFLPQANATRAEAVVIIVRLLEQLNKI